MKISLQKHSFKSFKTADLKQGQIIRGIVTDIDKNNAALEINGQKLSAEIHADVSRGDRIKAVVTEKKNGIWQLKIINISSKELEISPKELSSHLINIGMTDSEENSAFLKKIIAAELPATKQVFNDLFHIADILEKNAIPQKHIIDISMFLYTSKLPILNNNILSAIKLLVENNSALLNNAQHSLDLSQNNRAGQLKDLLASIGLDYEKLIAEKNIDDALQTLKYSAMKNNIPFAENIVSQQIGNTDPNTFYAEFPVEYNGERNSVKLKIKQNRSKNRSVENNSRTIALLLQLSSLGNIGIQYVHDPAHYKCDLFVEDKRTQQIMINNIDTLKHYFSEIALPLQDISVHIVSGEMNTTFFYDEHFQDHIAAESELHSVDIKI